LDKNDLSFLNNSKPFKDIWLGYEQKNQQKGGVLPAWYPTDQEIQETNLYQCWKEKELSSYDEFYQWSIQDKNAFWNYVVKKLGIVFDKNENDGHKLEDYENPIWFPDAKLNIAKSCFQAPQDKTAIIFQKEGGEIETISYQQLDEMSNRVANGLLENGLKAGDAVAIDMVMNVEAVAIYLGIVKAGMIVVSIADSFAPDEIQTRLRISQAKAIFTQDVIMRGNKELPLYEKVVKAEAPQAFVLSADSSMKVSLRENDIPFDQFISDKVGLECHSCSPDDISNILFSSGTTGDPKAIGWTHLTPVKSAMDGFFHHDIKPNDVVAWPTNLGWMMGPWLIYAAFINKATMALYYGAPMGEEFGKFIEKAKVSVFGLVPSIVKNWRESAVMEDMDWSSIKCFSSTGECSNPEDYLYLMSLANYRPVIEYCGGTEIGGGYITGSLVQAQIPSAFSTPTLGLSFYLLDEHGNESAEGEVFLVGPSIGLSQKLLNRNHHEVYFDSTPKGSKGEKLRKHGDQICHLGDGYYRGQGRADDTMNLGGIKTSSAEIERTLNAIDSIIETAAIAIAPENGGPSFLVIYAVVSEQYPNAEELKKHMQTLIKNNLNPLFKIQDLILTDSLPRTASNKVMRRVLRNQYKSS